MENHKAAEHCIDKVGAKISFHSFQTPKNNSTL